MAQASLNFKQIDCSYVILVCLLRPGLCPDKFAPLLRGITTCMLRHGSKLSHCSPLNTGRASMAHSVSKETQHGFCLKATGQKQRQC